MKKEPDHTDSSLSETMVARIEIKELGDLGRQKDITDALEALDGVIEVKFAKSALYVSCDPLSASEKKIRTGCPLHREYRQSRSHRYRNCTSRPANIEHARAENARVGEHP